MFRHKKMTVVALVLVLAISAWVFAAGESIEQKSILNGNVLSEGLVVENAKVKEGDVLVNIRTVTGSMAVAARATANGTVREVLVKPGDTVRQGDILVRIQLENAR